VVIDVRGKVANNFDYLVSLGDVAVWERDNAQIPVARTGWVERWDSTKDYRDANDNDSMSQ